MAALSEDKPQGQNKDDPRPQDRGEKLIHSKGLALRRDCDVATAATTSTGQSFALALKEQRTRYQWCGTSPTALGLERCVVRSDVVYL